MWVSQEVAGQGRVSTAVMPAEVSNALRRMELAGEISEEEAAGAHSRLLGFEAELYPFAPFAGRVWALRRNLTSYDAWYVALAETLDCPLVTIDHRLSRAPGPGCAFVTPPP